MEKKILVEKVQHYFNWSYGTSIDQIREDLDTLEELGATPVDIEIEDNYGSATIEYSATILREETDAEVMDRQIKQNIANAEQERFERQRLKELKEKYEK